MILEEEVEKMRIKKDIKGLIRDLNDDDPKSRENATYILSDLSDKRAVEPLIRALKDGSLNVKCEVVDVLGDLGGKKAVESLMEILNEKGLPFKGMYCKFFR